MKKFYVLVLVLFILDRLTKVAAVKGHVAFFDFLINPHLAFSIAAPKIALLLSVCVVILALMYVWFRQYKKKSDLIWPLGLIIIGAMSNLLDRMTYDGVIDWLPLLDLTIINLSDIYISIGVLWCLYYFASKR